jgi:hypothetical protein
MNIHRRGREALLAAALALAPTPDKTPNPTDETELSPPTTEPTFDPWVPPTTETASTTETLRTSGERQRLTPTSPSSHIHEQVELTDLSREARQASVMAELEQYLSEHQGEHTTPHPYTDTTFDVQTLPEGSVLISLVPTEQHPYERHILHEQDLYTVSLDFIELFSHEVFRDQNNMLSFSTLPEALDFMHGIDELLDRDISSITDPQIEQLAREGNTAAQYIVDMRQVTTSPGN